MADQFKETKTVAKSTLKSKFTSACGGIVIGIALFVGAFALLYSNEGSVDLSSIARDAIDLGSDSLDNEADGKLVNTTGSITSTETIGDDLFLASGEYIAVDRKVEMYAWVEETKTESSGDDTETTTYDYKKQWVETVTDSSQFKYPTDHTNPEKKYQNTRTTVKKAQIGVYEVEMDKVELPELEDLSLKAEKLSLKDGAILANNQYLFVSANTLSNIDAPQVGDLRISYMVLEPDTTVTAFGRLDGSTISSYVDEDNNKLFRIFAGSKDDALDKMHDEYTFKLWAYRVAGFLMMWIGLSLLLAPVTTLLDIIPVAGKIGKAIIGAITFVIALVLTILTIVISAILHNTLMLIVLTVLIVLGLSVVAYVFLKKKN